MNKRMMFAGFVALLLLGGLASGVEVVEEIQLVFGGGMHADFDASAGNQTLQSFNGARVYTDMGRYDFLASDGIQDISAVFGGATDTSAAGSASATFSNGSWSLALYKQGYANAVLQVSGGVVWYDEFEKSGNTVHGEGHITINWSSLYFDPSFWTNTMDWGDNGDGKSAIMTDMSSVKQDLDGDGSYTDDLQDYLHNWQSNSAVVAIWADSSNVVPEPATIALLGLGALTLVRRKRD